MKTGAISAFLVIALVFILFFSSCDDKIKVVESPLPSSPSASPTNRSDRITSPDTASFPVPGGPVEGPSVYGDPVTETPEETPSPGPSVSEPIEESPSPSPSPVVETPTPPEPSGPLAILSPPPPDPVTGKRPWIDLVFVIDTTGSMQDEIDVIKAKMDKMVDAIKSGLPVPYVRYGIVAYRDRGDAFVTYSFDLTSDTDRVYRSIASLRAGGGFDTEESVNEALLVAVESMNWDKGNKSKKLIFLIGDAGPHRNYPDDVDYREVCSMAAKKGIIIYSVGCSGIYSSGKDEFTEIASSTGGVFDFLTYRQKCRTPDNNRIWLLVAGGRNVALINDHDLDRWKEGYQEMIRKGIAKEPSIDLLAGLVPEGEPENNLDYYLVDKIKKEAEKMGVKYKKP